MQNKMKTQLVTKAPRIAVFREGAMGQRTRKVLAGVLAAAMLPFTAGVAWSHEAPSPQDTYDNGPQQGNYEPMEAEQLDQLVAPIALYPDSLVAQVLAAATYPQQVVAAEQFVQQSGNYPPAQLAEIANQQPWDPSVKSLVAFPEVLSNLNQNMDWTTQLGNAYYNQPRDVMAAVQNMRERAYAAGSLRSTPQLEVNYDPDDIVISPVSENIVYVPYYDPWTVYGEPIPVYSGYEWGRPRGVYFGGGLAIGFGVGLAIGAFTHYGWGYHHWEPNWRSREVFYDHARFVSHSSSVYNRGHFGGYNGHARNFRDVHFGGDRNGYNRDGNSFNRGGQTFNRDNNTVNRRGQTFNRDGNTGNRGANTFNRGGQTANPGARNFNHGGQTVNPGAQNFNRGGQTVNPGARNFNHGGQAVNPGAPNFNRGGQTVNPGAPNFNRGGQTVNPGARNFNRGGNTFNRGAYRAPAAPNRPQVNRGPANSRGPAPNHAQPRPAENHGGGQADHGHGGGHDHH